MGKNVLYLTEEYLKQLLDFHSRSLTGKVMKRFEILSDTKSIKESTKELIYESFRDLGKNIESYNNGVEVFEYKFKSQRG